jgi:hypothetical protein
LCINPPGIEELVVAESNIAMILGINKSGIATLVNTRENIIIPYLIVCDSCLAVETTL